MIVEDVKKQLLYISAISLIFLAIVAVLVSFTDPFKASAWIVFFLYISLAAFCISAFTLLFYSLRSKSEALHYQKLKSAYREALLISLFIIGSLALSSKGLLFWWIEAVFILALSSIEIFFLV